jgi:WD40 repeat protein
VGVVSTQPVTKVAWSPDRHLTFQLVLDGALISTEVPAGRSLVLKRLGLGHVVSGLTWSPNGRCLALADTVAGSQTELQKCR